MLCVHYCDPVSNIVFIGTRHDCTQACCLYSCTWTPSTHWSPYKIPASLQTTYLNAFPCMKIMTFVLKLEFFPIVQWTINQHRFRWWIGAEQVIRHYLNQSKHSLLTHMYPNRPQCVKRPRFEVVYKGIPPQNITLFQNERSLLVSHLLSTALSLHDYR